MTQPTFTPLVCYNHPDRETMLRCNRCERPICNQCSVLTPTGYRCKECVRGQQKTFETAQSTDLLWGGLIAVVLSFLGSFTASFMGFLTVFVGPIIGILIAEAVRWAVRRRRSKRLFQVATGAAVVGALPVILFRLLAILAYLTAGGFSVYLILPLVWQGLYAFLVASTVYYRLSGITVRR